MADSDLKLEALVLRRTNYGETDRIVNFLTPAGKKAALVRGARKEKSKLAGGIELFCLTEITLHESPKGYDGMAILTSAKTKKFYQNIIGNLEALELGSDILKKASRAADNFDSLELFEMVRECLEAIDQGSASYRLIKTYFLLKLATICGEEINLITDSDGQKLDQMGQYHWDGFAKVLIKNEKGKIGADHIKLMRVIVSGQLKLVAKVKNLEPLLEDLEAVVRTFE